LARFGEVLFSGSRFVFWALSPCLLAFAVALPLLTSSWPLESILLVSVLSGTSLLLVLALYDLKRFAWAGRSATAIVFVAYVAFLVDEIHKGDPWRFAPRSDGSPLDALLGLVVIGLPCLRYTVTGSLGTSHQPMLGIQRFLVGPCAQCEKSLEEHDFVMFACTVANDLNKLRVEAFFNSIRCRDWRALSKFTEFEGDKNNLEAFVIRCSPGGVLMVLWSPFELCEDDQLRMQANLSAAEMREIEELVPKKFWTAASSNR
jgi:hypothetical protein